MSAPPVDVELIVQSVLKQIQASGAKWNGPSSAEKPAAPAVSSVKHFSQRVITADLLSGKLNSGDEVTVDAKAILTPSAHDYLKSLQVSWTRASALKPAVKPTAAVESSAKVSASAGSANLANNANKWLAIRVEASGLFDTAFKTVQKQTQAQVFFQNAASTEEAAQNAISELNRGQASRILLVTNRPALAACLANRQERIRAVSVRRLADLESIEEVQANVICLADKGPAISDYLQILRKLFS